MNRAPTSADEARIDALMIRLADWHKNPTTSFTTLEELLNESRVLMGAVEFPAGHRIHVHHQSVKAALRDQYAAAERAKEK